MNGKANETGKNSSTKLAADNKSETTKDVGGRGEIMNEKVREICKALSAKLATDIKIVAIKGVSDIADYFVLCSGRSAPQVKAIYDNLEETLEKQNIFALRKEGISEGRWIAVDYGDVIVHIFHKDTREIYALDTLWNNGANVSDYNED